MDHMEQAGVATMKAPAPKRGKKHRSYKTESLAIALLAIKLGKLDITKASLKYCIPRSTLRSRLQSKPKTNYISLALSTSEESSLVAWLQYRNMIGSTVHWPELSQVVFEFLSNASASTSASAIKPPTTGWLQGFKRRHPDVPLRKSKRDGWYSPLEFSPYTMISWVKKMTEFLQFNAVLGSFSFGTGSKNIFCLGRLSLDKSVYSFVETQTGKEYFYNILFSFNSFGEYTKPALFCCEMPAKCHCHDIFDVNLVNHETDSFNVWFPHFLIQIEELCVQRPILLLLDVKLAFVNMANFKLAKQNEVYIYCFPLHSEECQPPEVGILRNIRAELLHDDSINETTSYKNFTIFFEKLWHKYSTPELAIEGFEQCGIVPFASSPSQLIKVDEAVLGCVNAIPYNSDVVKGMEISLKIIEKKCMDEMYLPLYKEFYNNGTAPINDSMYSVWKEMTENIKKAKQSIIKSTEISTGSDVQYLGPVLCSDSVFDINDNIETDETSVNVPLTVNLGDSVPISDRYRREFNFDSMSALNLEQHSLEILEQYQASLDNTTLEQLEINLDTDFEQNF